MTLKIFIFYCWPLKYFSFLLPSVCSFSGDMSFFCIRRSFIKYFDVFNERWLELVSINSLKWLYSFFSYLSLLKLSGHFVRYISSFFWQCFVNAPLGSYGWTNEEQKPNVYVFYPPLLCLRNTVPYVSWRILTAIIVFVKHRPLCKLMYFNRNYCVWETPPPMQIDVF